MDYWDLYFASIAAMSLHPGYNRGNVEKLDIKDCAKIADEMLKEREKRLCHSLQQHSP